ncbi:MAG: MarR family winged helix-turn-helix transcriptional regulator [Pigmentiphaga sp.]
MPNTMPPAWIDPHDAGDTLDLQQFPTLLLQQTAQHQRQAHILPLLATHELSVPEYRTLAILDVHGRVNTARIRELSSMDKAQLSRTLQQLERRGFIERSILPNHERRHWLTLTPEGSEVFGRATEDVRAYQVGLLRSLTSAEREALYAVVRKLGPPAD